MSVYFAEVGPYIKIGFSRNPEQRVRRLFSSATRDGAPADAPTDLASRRLIRAIPGDMGTEWQVHTALTDFAVGNEWFLNEPEVRDFIATADQGDFSPVRRPAGKYEPPDFTPEDEALLMAALSRILAPEPPTVAALPPEQRRGRL